MKLPDFKVDLFSRKSGGEKAGANSPNVKAPKFLGDLYKDLRDRRLIPLVILLIVAIAAVPFVLGGKGGEEEEPVAVAPIANGSSAEQSFSVVPAARRLRAYGDRLGYRKSRNPFNSSAVGNPREGEEAEESGAESSGGGVGPSEGSSEGGTVVKTKVITITKEPKIVKARIKAQIGYYAVVKAGYTDGKPKQYEVEAQGKLPQKNAAVVYTGTSKKGGALFLMTSQVSEYSGDGHCALGGPSCQVVEQKPKDSETFAIGYGGSRYKIRLLGFKPIFREGVVEYEGKKVRFPSKKKQNQKQKQKGNGSGSTQVGNEPSPRSLAEQVPANTWQLP